MFYRIKSLIESSNNIKFENSRIYLNYVVKDKECLKFLQDQDVVLSPNNIEAKTCLKLELSIAKLRSIGYYISREDFISRNKYEVVKKESLYIHNIGKVLIDDFVFLESYEMVIDLIKSLERLSIYNYSKKGVNVSLFKGDNNVLTLFYDYSCEIVLKMGKEQKESIRSFLLCIKEGSSKEREYFFLSELVDFLMFETEKRRFQKLLIEFDLFFEKAESAYKYYLRDYSSNKFKIEIDLKALEYTQKIQSVINDSQTRLIAIPTAFIFSVGIVDFEKVSSTKNIVVLISLIMFAIIIQLFLDNQRTALNFIKENIISYKESFSQVNRFKVEQTFKIVDKEVRVQFFRLRIVNCFLWFIPSSFIFIFLFIFAYKNSKLCIFLTTQIFKTLYSIM